MPSSRLSLPEVLSQDVLHLLPTQWPRHFTDGSCDGALSLVWPQTHSLVLWSLASASCTPVALLASAENLDGSPCCIGYTFPEGLPGWPAASWEVPGLSGEFSLVLLAELLGGLLDLPFLAPPADEIALDLSLIHI